MEPRLTPALLTGDPTPGAAPPPSYPAGHEPYWDIESGSPLTDEVRMSGFKHLMVGCMAAACLSEEPWDLHNAPELTDRQALAGMLGALGAHVGVDAAAERVLIDAAPLTGHRVPADWSAQVHGGAYLLPVLLARHGQVESGAHGGCRIGGGHRGGRPVQHIARVLERFGATCATDDGGLTATAPRGLRGAVIDLAEFSTPDPHSGLPTGPHYSGATKTALLAAASARGTTVLRHPYPKPDAQELARVLALAGVAVDVTPDAIEIQGADGPIGAASVTLPSDLLEVVTFVTASVLLDQELTLRLTRPDVVREGLAPELRHLRRIGVPLRWDGDMLHIRPAVGPLTADRVVAASHLVYSDAQPLFALLLLAASAPSTLVETVWSGRFGYVDGLRSMGARLAVDGQELRIHPGPLRPAPGPLRGTDLRAAAALLLAALAVGTPHRLYGVEHLARGYARLPAKLRALGGRITPGTTRAPDVPGATDVAGTQDKEAFHDV
ncbi:hypothetical protein ACIQVO_02475 [Streptomyces sp. NPDC101062]|uniref:UDP-N-acetylglucosamine 1-carboxyvinyltransferase n=1 Tax=Streptomyces chromofuscus TaxID=42881 RepID=H6UP55_STRCW|nr:UDP-N-acetylglucosamine 1-carboxyvinyltransferase [Streptomyces chromofuscus]